MSLGIGTLGGIRGGRVGGIGSRQRDEVEWTESEFHYKEQEQDRRVGCTLWYTARSKHIPTLIHILVRR